MIFKETKLEGAFVISLEKHADDRGFLARAFCKAEFEKRGLRFQPVQANIARSNKLGTLRGLHYQTAPFEEAKLVRCIRGRIFDVMIDLRHSSSTYGQWYGVELTADGDKMLYVPEGFAHGYQTLEDDSEIYYQTSSSYTPDAEKGVRWNDPNFGIQWPHGNPILSGKDQSWSDFISTNRI